jgi:hypothetical protein
MADARTVLVLRKNKARLQARNNQLREEKLKGLLAAIAAVESFHGSHILDLTSRFGTHIQSLHESVSDEKCEWLGLFGTCEYQTCFRGLFKKMSELVVNGKPVFKHESKHVYMYYGKLSVYLIIPDNSIIS